MSEFSGKVVWITGASSGYGKALAIAFSEVGAKVIISARREDELVKVASALKNVKVVLLDLEKPNTFPQKTIDAISAFGSIDLIIHNGAVAQNSSALETESAVARKIMEIDYFSYTELTRAILPYFIAQKSGHIVVVSGLLARLTLPGRSSYAAAKAALLGYFGSLRAELINDQIDVTILIPGAMQTGLTTKALKADGAPQNTAPTNSGCSVDDAAIQSLKAIANKEYEAYIGLADESYELWKLTQWDPKKGIELFLNQFKKG